MIGGQKFWPLVGLHQLPVGGVWRGCFVQGARVFEVRLFTVTRDGALCSEEMDQGRYLSRSAIRKLLTLLHPTNHLMCQHICFFSFVLC